MSESSFSDRRSFLRKAALGTAGLLVLPRWAEAMNFPGRVKRLTILHTNDMHSRIDPFPETDPQYPGLGGMERRAAMIEQIRKSEKNVLLLDAGDVFQGTPYFNFFGGEPELRLMSKMRYDAATMGNHDFDNGLEGFLKVLPHADFPFICSNYDFSDTILNKQTLDHKIFVLDGLKIGVFGLGIQLNGLVGKKNYGKTHYLDPIQVAAERSDMLKKAGCRLIICLSHLGYSYNSEKISDLKLARESRDIDIIIGGHTHTFMQEANMITNMAGKKVLVNQAGWAGLVLGRIDVEFTHSKEKDNDFNNISYIVSSNKDVI